MNAKPDRQLSSEFFEQAPDKEYQSSLAFSEAERELKNLPAISLFNAVSQALLLLNDDGYVIDANPCACELLKLTWETLIGRSLKAILVSQGVINIGNLFPISLISSREGFLVLEIEGLECSLFFVITPNIWSGRHLLMLQLDANTVPSKTTVDPIEISQKSKLAPINLWKDSNLDTEERCIQASDIAQEPDHFIATRQGADDSKCISFTHQKLHACLDSPAYSLEQENPGIPFSEERCRSVIETQTELVCRYTPEGKLTFANPAYCQFFACNPDDLSTRNFITLISEIEHGKTDQQTQKLLKLTPDLPLLIQERQISLSDGQTCWQQWIHRALFNEKGQVIEFQATGRDITDIKQTEAALLEAHQQLQALIRNSPAVIVLFDETGRYRKVNPVAAATLGFTESEIEGRRMVDFFPVELVDAFMERVRQILETNCPQIMEDRLPVLGEERIFRSIVFPVSAERSKPRLLCTIATDVTSLVEAQATLRRQAEQERLSRVITQHIHSSLDLNFILATTVEHVRHCLDTDRVVILRFDADWGSEVVVESVREPWASVLGKNFHNPHSSEGIFEHYRQGFIRQITNIQTDDIDPHFRDFLASLQIQANLIVPLLVEGELWGLLCIDNCSEPRHWTQDEQLLIKQVASQLAIAIQQGELYQQAQAEIAERMRLEAQLRHDAFHDSLTGLPNRVAFLERLQVALQHFQREYNRIQASQTPSQTTSELSERTHDAQFAVLFLDLDRFKVVNDSLGHSVGDQLLKLVAHRLTDCLRKVDLAARLGGDEFVVLLEELTNTQYAIEVARRIHTALEAPILLEGHEVFIHTSIGITFSSIDYTDPIQILRDADIAMYKSKESKQKYVVFNPAMHTFALERMHLENDLRRAVQNQEFRLHYQPIVSLKTNRIIGFEALVRWQHPTRGLLYPSEFMGIAEDTGLITAIDLWVLRETCSQLRAWQNQFPGLSEIAINVNLSGKQFSQPDLIAQIDRALSETQLDGRFLKMEITESVLIRNAPHAIQILNQ